MDYSALAAELLSFRTALHHLPAVRGLDEMSGGEYFVLHFLLRHGGTAGPSELSRSLYASSARIAALLKHLEAKGWIVRTPDADDERRVDVVLTEAGAACIRERLGAVLDEVSVLLSALSPEEAAEYVRLQRKLLEKGGTVGKDPSTGGRTALPCEKRSPNRHAVCCRSF